MKLLNPVLGGNLDHEELECQRSAQTALLYSVLDRQEHSTRCINTSKTNRKQATAGADDERHQKREEQDEN